MKYCALSSSTTRLAQTSLLKGLASLNTDTHRKAAEKVLARLSEEDKHLIDELSGDLDSIIRELSVPAIERLNLLSNGQRVTKLLRDKSPSVRTAVLRSLSQRANGEAVDALLAYIDQESDEDLFGLRG
ncbi:MAG: HEAT repeat domain-containing protein [Pirellulales bacterium]